MIGGPEAGTSGVGGREQEHAGNSTEVVKSCADTDKLLLQRKSDYCIPSNLPQVPSDVPSHPHLFFRAPVTQAGPVASNLTQVHSRTRGHLPSSPWSPGLSTVSSLQQVFEKSVDGTGERRGPDCAHPVAHQT